MLRNIPRVNSGLVIERYSLGQRVPKRLWGVEVVTRKENIQKRGMQGTVLAAECKGIFNV